MKSAAELEDGTEKSAVTRESIDIRSQRSIQPAMIGCVIADDIGHRRTGSARVMAYVG
jgi:hypothetical protein